MKKIILGLLCLVLALGVFAQEIDIPVTGAENSISDAQVQDVLKSTLLGDFNWPFSLDKLNVGGSLGTNMNSHNGWAMGWGFHGDYELWDKLGFGFQLNMSHDFVEMFTLETSLYAKWFMPFKLAMFEPFARFDMGASIMYAEKTYGAFLSGISAGARCYFGNLYLEPMLSFGYPYCLAVNVVAGWSF